MNNNEQMQNNQIEMKDCDYLNDMLSTEKSMSNNYSTALNEFSNNYLYEEILKIYKDTQDSQRYLFDIMISKGWYKIEPAPEQKITTLLQEHENKMNELPGQQQSG